MKNPGGTSAPGTALYPSVGSTPRAVTNSSTRAGSMYTVPSANRCPTSTLIDSLSIEITTWAPELRCTRTRDTGRLSSNWDARLSQPVGHHGWRSVGPRRYMHGRRVCEFHTLAIGE